MKELLKKLLHSNVLLGIALVLLAVGIAEWNNLVYAANDAHHFKLSTSYQYCDDLPKCEVITVIDNTRSHIAGYHDYRLYPLVGSADYEDKLAWTNVSQSRVSPELENADMELGIPCRIGLVLNFQGSDVTNLIGLTSITDDGFGDIQKFSPVSLKSEQIYMIYDLRHSNNSDCIFRVTQNGRAQFGVYVNSDDMPAHP